MKIETKLLDCKKDISLFDQCIELASTQIKNKKRFRYNKQDTIRWLHSIKSDFLLDTMIVSCLLRNNEIIGFYCALKLEVPNYFLRYIAIFESNKEKFNEMMDLLDKPVLDRLESKGFFNGLYVRSLTNSNLEPMKIFKMHDKAFNKRSRYITFIEHIIYSQDQLDEILQNSSYRSLLPKKFIEPIVLFSHRLKNEYRIFNKKIV